MSKYEKELATAWGGWFQKNHAWLRTRNIDVQSAKRLFLDGYTYNEQQEASKVVTEDQPKSSENGKEKAPGKPEKA